MVSDTHGRLRMYPPRIRGDDCVLVVTGGSACNDLFHSVKCHLRGLAHRMHLLPLRAPSSSKSVTSRQQRGYPGAPDPGAWHRCVRVCCPQCHGVKSPNNLSASLSARWWWIKCVVWFFGGFFCGFFFLEKVFEIS